MECSYRYCCCLQEAPLSEWCGHYTGGLKEGVGNAMNDEHWYRRSRGVEDARETDAVTLMPPASMRFRWRQNEV